MNRLSAVMLIVALSAPLHAAELVRLSESNWQDYAPEGKEVDWIYGDYVLRNDKIIAVIADPIPSRHANLTVKHVGGSILDLTLRDRPNDQLSAFYPEAGRFELAAVEDIETPQTGNPVVFRCAAPAEKGKPAVEVKYELFKGAHYIHVTTTYRNPHDEPVAIERTDAVRADREFAMDIDEPLNLFWAFDEWWGQAYAVAGFKLHVAPVGRTLQQGRPVLKYVDDAGSGTVEIPPGEAVSWTRFIFPAANLLELKTHAAWHRLSKLRDVEVTIQDADGPIEKARVEIAGLGWARTPKDGMLRFGVPNVEWKAVVTAIGRPTKSFTIGLTQKKSYVLELERPGYVEAEITDADGGPNPCKVQFVGLRGVKNPNFGPDTEVHGVRNLYYTENGRFRQAIAPGRYRVIVSRGPEYDAVFQEIDVVRGKTTKIEAKLVRSVDTAGWISADFHSHSSPSGDNTTSQRGRVLNLLAEHIEFGPCTEHNRVSSYAPHLKALGGEKLMATCTGIEVTGSPLPVNHQNAFPLVHKPHTQDGGGPTTDADPVVQIERLALWDDGAEKVVQGNHPNIPQILGDRDLDGKTDGGFEKMFGLMDVVEVHPPGDIFSTPTELPTAGRGRGKPIFHWMQMLNLGYRIPGVVNTDAHYDFHGSGWLRNYIKSPTDDPAEIKTLDMVHAAEHGRMTMTNGPFLEVELSAGEKTVTAGGEVAATDGKATLHVRVQCPNWLDVNRVQIFKNGRADPDLNFTRRTHAEMFGEDAVKFEQAIELSLDADAHIIVAAAGEGLGLGEVMGPEHASTMPIAVSNPIFVDVDGKGFKANGDTLGLELPRKNTR